MSFHKFETFASLHNLHFRDYANAAARLGDATLVAADIGKVARQTDTSQYYILQNHSPITWAPITGSGAGSGGINYVATNDSDAADSVGNWIAYNDADAVPLSRPGGATPGSGGVPTVTITRSTISPLRGTASFLVTKTAVNSQGQGVSVPFTIDSVDQAKTLSVTFDYSPSAGFVSGSDSVDSDIECYVYDVTNNSVIQLAPYKLTTAGTFTGSYGATFQTAGNSTSYRLIFHIATTNASAWTFKFDNVRVGPQIVASQPIASDWTTYTPVIAGLGAGSSTPIARYRRVGDSIEISFSIVKDATPGSGAALVTMSLPPGLLVDDAKIGGTSDRTVVGAAQFITAAFTGIITSTIVSNANDVINFGNNTTGNGFTGADFPANRTILGEARIPIQGWSSNITLIAGNIDNSVVSASWRSGSNQSIANGSTPISVVFATKLFDTHNAFDGVSTFTAPIPGKYVLQTMISWGNVENWTDSYNRLFVYINGAVYLPIDTLNPHAVLTSVRLGPNVAAITLNLNAGDLVTLRVQHDQAAPRTVTNNAITLNETWFSIARVSDAPLNIPQDNSILPAGAVLPFAGTTTPSGFLPCDGASVDRVVYGRLFTAIGTTHGTASGSTFNVPDYRGRFLRGVDGAAGRDPNSGARTAMNAGGNINNNVGSVQAQATAKNGLALTDPGHTHTTLTGLLFNSNATVGGATTLINYGAAGTSPSIGTSTTGITLGAGDAETRPLNAYVNYIIKI